MQHDLSTLWIMRRTWQESCVEEVAPMSTPYDGKVAVWYVYGGMVGERTIDQIAGTLQQYAPAVSAVFVKVTDGTDWMGSFESTSDPKPDLAINGPADIN